MDINYTVEFTSEYKGATLEQRRYPQDDLQTVVTYGSDYLGSFNGVPAAKAAVTRYLTPKGSTRAPLPGNSRGRKRL